MTIDALYIDKGGPYPTLLGEPRCWDFRRDARSYDGPGPVVAHPPCGPWGRLSHLYKGNDHDCGPRAVEQVRKFGGVLEHPAGSRLWDGAHNTARPLLPLPESERMFSHHEAEDAFGGFTIEVDQVEWGHVARKRTWLYIVGVPRERVQALIDARPFPGAQPTHWVSGRRRMPNPADNVPPGIKVCSAEQRRRTPPAFAEFLIALAEHAARKVP